jgi:Right handed beta helix region/Protein of unknown function (DUF1565)
LTRRGAWTAFAALLLLGGLTALVLHLGRPTPGPHRYVSPRGTDAGSGSSRHPWKTLQRALRNARPGETIVLGPGTYGERGRRFVWSASGTPGHPISIVGGGGSRTVIMGYNKVTGSHLVLRHLVFLGPTGPVDPRTPSNPGGEDVPIWIAGSDISLVDSEVTGSRWHAGVYVNGGPFNKLIGDYVHDNGDFSRPSQSNLDQGIYWGGGSDGLILRSVVAHNLANGVQLYPAAQRVTVERDTVVGNGTSGVIVAGRSADNVIANDIVADNAQTSVRSFDLTGAGNLVANNIVYNNDAGDLGVEDAGLSFRGNMVAAPRFAGIDDYRLRRDSPAIGRAVSVAAPASGAVATAATVGGATGGNIGAYQGDGIAPGAG